MTTTAFIPARGGSKRIRGKNMRLVNGYSLVSRAVHCAEEAGVDRIIVSSDDDRILDEAITCGALAHRRPEHLATDTASIEAAMLTTNLGHDDNIVVLLQPTSPLRLPRHVVEAVRMVEDGWDSACSVSVAPELYFGGRLKGFEFRPDRSLEVRRRTQDLSAYAYENGAVYATTAGRLRQTRQRMSGRIGAVVMEGWTGLDVDDEDDLYVAEWLAKRIGVREMAREGQDWTLDADEEEERRLWDLTLSDGDNDEVWTDWAKRWTANHPECFALDREDANDDPC